MEVFDRTLWFLSLYGIEILIAFLFSAFTEMKSEKKKVYLFISLGILAFLTMFRAPTVGNDTSPYMQYFNIVHDMELSQALNFSRFESGFVALTVLLGHISHNHQILFITIGIFIYFSLGRWLYKWSSAPGLFICLFVSMLQFDSWMSACRQVLAIAILLFAYDAIIEHNRIRFLLLVLCASLFHNSAFVFVLAYPAVNLFQSGKKRTYFFESLILVFTVAVTVSFNKILHTLLSIFPVYSYYLNSEYTDGEPRLALLLKAFVYGMLLLLPRIISRHSTAKDPSALQETSATYKLSWLNLAFIIIANNATIISRVASIFSIFPILDYTKSVRTQRLTNNRIILTVASLLAFALYGLTITILKTPQWQSTYPYIFCWQV